MNLSPDDQIIIHVEITNRFQLGKKLEKKILISRNKTYILGRSKKQSHIVLDDDAASRQHLEFRLIRNKVWIRDLQTKNGTFLNAKNIDNRALKQGDLISIGDHHIYIKHLEFSVGVSEATSQFIIAKQMETTRKDITVTNLLRKMIG